MEANYTEHGIGNEICKNCKHFESPNYCHIVEGIINPGGWCKNFDDSESLSEKWGVATKVSPSEKGKYAGKTKSELLKSYNSLKKSGPHKKGSEDYSRMRELAFAIRAKGGWGKVKEEK